MNGFTENTKKELFPQGVSEAHQVHNHEMNIAWQYVASTSQSVFLTGKAGTGKTTFLRKLRELAPKRMVVLAPTGVAAINAQGQTIHSFFQLPLGPNIPGMSPKEGGARFRMSKEKKQLIKTLDLLVIDEISMVRCDLLDAVDREMRKYRNRNRPFGGAQLLLIGDLQQLAPVTQDKEWNLLSPYYTTPYFFDSKALAETDYVTIELKHIYRQQDERFIHILAAIRENQADSQVIADLNQRYIPKFLPPKEEDWIRLTTHNRMAKTYNEARLDQLPDKLLHYKAEVKGNFPETSFPAEQELILKKGAQVMFVRNDPSANKDYYNGKIGIVEGTEWDENNHQELICIHCKEDETTVMLPPTVWENTKYVIDEESKEIREEIEGTFKQYPLRLAWAITIHKSQGLTFNHAVLDINASFTHGQVYVALSRCRTLEGLVLAHPLKPTSIITDISVNTYIQREIAEGEKKESMLPHLMQSYYLALLDELFDFGQLQSDFNYLTRVIDEHLYAQQPALLKLMKESQERLKTEVTEVALKFQAQYQQLTTQTLNPSKNPKLQKRLQSAFGYFLDKLIDIMGNLLPACAIPIGNKQVNAQFNNALDAFLLQFKVKTGILKRLMAEGSTFTVKDYLQDKAKAALDNIPLASSKQTSKKRTSKDTRGNKRVVSTSRKKR